MENPKFSLYTVESFLNDSSKRNFNQYRNNSVSAIWRERREKKKDPLTLFSDTASYTHNSKSNS